MWPMRRSVTLTSNFTILFNDFQDLFLDLANPKTNTKNAGFTKEERADFTELLSAGYIDSYRHLYPKKRAAYTFWSYMRNARAQNIGW